MNLDKEIAYSRYSQPVPRDLIYKVLDYLKYRKMQFIVSPYESDAQLAYLYHQKKIDIVLSEDSDMFAYGVMNIIRELKNTGHCKYLNLNKTKFSNELVGSMMKLSEFNRT